MKIHPIVTNNSLQNIFYILEYTEGKAIIIDPCDNQMCQDFLRVHNLTGEKICITHEHYDHYSGVRGLDCKEIYSGEICAQNIDIEVSHILQDGEEINLSEEISLRAISTPGHAAGHMIFELYEDVQLTAIFSGDVLFAGGVGNTRTGSMNDLYHSLQKFERYDDTVMIYSGHDYLENNFKFTEKYLPEKNREFKKILEQKGEAVYFTNLGEERCINPFIGVSQEEFIRLRELRNNF